MTEKSGMSIDIQVGFIESLSDDDIEKAIAKSDNPGLMRHLVEELRGPKDQWAPQAGHWFWSWSNA